jgi:hypothetical protein
MTTNPPSVSRALFARMRSSQRVRTVCNDYATYERRKSEWATSHPGASPAEYDAAMRRIASDLGV